MNYIVYEKADHIASITLNRPDKSNALSPELVAELRLGFKAADDDPDVKIIVLKANGDVFCAGADLTYLQDLQSNSFEQNLADSQHLKELYVQIYQCRKAVIAQVHAHALAGGCGLVTVCDFIFTVPDANFGYTEVRIGFVPAIVMVFLLRRIGEGHARRLLVGGSVITAAEALSMGLVNFVVEKDVLEKEVRDFALQLIENNSAYAAGVTRQLIAKVQSLPLQEALDFAAEMNAKARGSEDCKRGIAAFLNKEKPDWTDVPGMGTAEIK